MRGRLLLAAAVLLAVAGALLHPFPLWDGPPPAADGPVGVDVGLYTAVVEGLREGGGYYEVLGAELRGREFPRRPMFNWRTPLHLNLLALFPSLKAAVGLYMALVLAAAAPVVLHLKDRGPAVLTGGLLLLISALLPMAQVKGIVFAEVWCGTALLLSLGLRLHQRWVPAALAGLLALFFRELAAPWLVVMTLVDLRARRWPAVGAWLAGAAAYAVYFGLHAAQVQAHLLPGIDDHVRSWVGIGGPSFVLATLGFLAPVAIWPRLAGGAAAFSLLGALSSRASGATALRIGLPLWFGFLTLFGQPFNSYWGCVGVPAVALGLCLALPELRRLATGSGD